MDFFTTDSAEDKAQAQTGLAPLADRMRPRTLDEFVGQDKIVGTGTALRKAIETDTVSSMIFWGPPGSGKTTLARLIAGFTRGQFIPFSAVSSGIKEVKEVISKAGHYYQLTGRRTYIFVDEIHRFNKAQQDAFLPYVEKGDIILIGATTENPSFEVISALMSRVRVYVLQRLSTEALKIIVQRCLEDSDRGLGKMNLRLEEQALEFLVAAADGDARRALTLLEATATYLGSDKLITVSNLTEVHQKSVALYDKAGDEHFNLISALHKSLRGGDPDASLYWLARMLDGGDDPMYLARRLVRFAAEDVGLADPYALTLAISARDAYHFLGSPEGELALAELVIYLACAPKSNATYVAFEKAQADAAQKGSLPVPLHIRNAPTALMKALDYAKGYKYPHEYEEALTDQQYFPDELKGTEYYHPKEAGQETKLAEYMRKYKEYRAKVMQRTKE
ncbi:MAG TPA: replication-associated recombination protein A [Candidatus Deferrimicrobium sp.]|nr:replication-associated recombination protein A [Candidatus Deferrimicrobium sp.]